MRWSQQCAPWKTCPTSKPSDAGHASNKAVTAAVFVNASAHDYHLVAGSKETRLAASIEDPAVLITGHPFVDVWAGIRPRVLGLDRWPEVPKGRPWKQGVCAALGEQLDSFWPKLRNRVTTYADLEPELVGAVERAIDFASESE